jgi:hypothetical protein
MASVSKEEHEEEGKEKEVLIVVQGAAADSSCAGQLNIFTTQHIYLPTYLTTCLPAWSFSRKQW